LSDPVFVAVEIDGRVVEVGTAYFTRRGNSLSTAFRYDDQYLARPDAYAIDPAMPLSAGNHVVAGVPGAFADCSPDRWGRNLVTKLVRARALREGRTAPSVSEVDFLLGVSDLTRQGALRFRKDREGRFLDPDLTVPKMVELPRLLRAADAVESDADDMTAIKDLLDAGSGSLGGARPKASVRHEDSLFVAKFPHRSDDWDLMAWEMTALDLAEEAGIETPPHRLTKVDGRSVLIVQRFDRYRDRRIGYLSAMTLVGGQDGAAADYVEIAETLTEFGARTVADLRQLWRRVAFSIAINNTDDHLRNHGFLRDGPAGWRLSPLFDVNPNPDPSAQRVTGIGGGYTGDDEVQGLLAYAGSFRVRADDARAIVREVVDATSHWRQVAAGNGVPAAELSRFTDVFESQRDRLGRLVT
jgi:serine/threonine-protein kinase HipA